MEKTASMNFGDYFFELGNRFFNVEQNQWEVLNNDLDYEEREREGFNGLMLKLEQQSDEYSYEFRSFLSRIVLWIKTLFIKPDGEQKVSAEHVHESRFPNADAQIIIDMRVRKRLLKSLNEDAHLWLESPYQKRNTALGGRKSPYHRNCFKSEKVQVPDKSIAFKSKVFKRLLSFIGKKVRKPGKSYVHFGKAGESKNMLIS